METHSNLLKSTITVTIGLGLSILAWMNPIVTYGQGIHKKKIPSVANLKISTEIPATLYFDKDTSLVMNPDNQVVIFWTSPGPHTLIFRNKSMEVQKKVMIDSGATCYYKLRKDSAISDSVVKGRLVSLHPQTISSYYIPFKEAFTMQFRPGYAFRTNGSGFDGQIIAGYYFNQKFSLGLGTGFNSYSTHMVWTSLYIHDWPDIDQVRTTYFPVSSVPVFLNISLFFAKKRFTPYLSFSGGLSLPVTRSATGNFNSGDTYYGSSATTYYFRIDRMNMGGYIGIDFGCKYYITHMVDMGLSFGFDMNFNSFNVRYYDDPDFQNYVSARTYHDVRAAFCIRLVVGLNFSKETIHPSR
ncbi:MAG: hypothetical protein NTY96_07580 [Bacteroidetes bacterium]|nr:hypothetical protein [Bacteroidota bacterium]